MGKKRGKVVDEKRVDYAHMPTCDAFRKAFEDYGDGKIFAVTDRSPGELDVIEFEAVRRLAIYPPEKPVEFRIKVALICLQAFGHVGKENYYTKVKFLCYVGGKYRNVAIDCPPFLPEYGTEARQAFMETVPEVVFAASEKVRHALATEHPPMRPLASAQGERAEDD